MKNTAMIIFLAITISSCSNNENSDTIYRLEQEVEDLKSELDDAKSKINDLEYELSSLQSDVRSNTYDISQLQY